MKLLNVPFDEPLRVVIDGLEYEASRKLKLQDHIFNQSGSQLQLKNVYPKASDTTTRLIPYKLPKFSLGEVYFGNTLMYFGVVKVQKGGSLNPRKPKHMDLTIVSYKEWLLHKFMDFPIINDKPETIIDRVLTKLSNPRIKKGTISFGNSNRIKVYNTTSKNAWDTLRLIERHTNSLLQILTEDDGTISINFYNKQSIINSNGGNKGIDMIFNDQDEFDTFMKTYGVIDFQWAENNMKNRNFVRVESEGIIASKPQIQQIDLTQQLNNIELQFPVGAVDNSNTFIIDNFGKKRRVIVVTSEDDAKKKKNDIVYSLNSNTISLNDRILKINGILTFTYYPLRRLSLDLQDSQDKQSVESVAGGGDGTLSQYEKFNDITSTDDLLAMGTRFLETGIDEKIKLMVDSEIPIWELGQHTVFKGIDTDGIDGEYIVREVNVTLWGDNDDGALRKTFEYSLIKSFDAENELNKNDSLSYRDNPIFNAEDAVIDVNTPIDYNLYVLAKELIVTCDVFKDNELQLELQADIGKPEGPKYNTIDLGGSS